MRSSEFAYDIQIYEYSTNTNDYGELVPSFLLKYEEYAARKREEGDEDVESDTNRRTYNRRDTWTIRYAGQSISINDELRHDGERYEIVDVPEIVNQRLIRIRTRLKK